MAKINSLRGLPEFVAVAELGTFSSAAREFDVSVSHISRQIADLESRLSAQLFLRTTRQMQLTESGQRLYDTAQPLMAELELAQQVTAQAQGQLGGPIRVTLAGRYAEEEIVPRMLRFAAMHPDIELDIDISARNIDLLSERFHLGIRLGPMKSTSSLVATRLLDIPMRLLASPDWLDRMGGPRTPSDLPTGDCLALGRREWILWRQNAHVVIQPAGRIRSNSGAALVRAAASGLGVTLVPSWYAQPALETGALVSVLPDWQSQNTTTLYCVTPTARHVPQRVRSLIEYLREKLTSP